MDGFARRRGVAGAVIAASLTWSGASGAIQPQAPSGTGPATTLLAGQMDLARLVDLASERLRINIEYDASTLRHAGGSPSGTGGGASGGVTIRLGALAADRDNDSGSPEPSGLTDDELWEFVNRTLSARGLTTVRVGAVSYAVVRVSDAASLARVEPSVDLRALDRATLGPHAQAGDAAAGRISAGFRAISVRAHHRAARDLVEPLQRAMSFGTGGAGGGSGVGAGGGVAITAVGPGEDGVLVLTGLTPRLVQAIDLLAVLDVPGPRTVVREVVLRNVGAVTMAALLKQVREARRAAAGDGSGGGAGAFGGGGGGGSGGGGGGDSTLVGEVIPLPDTVGGGGQDDESSGQIAPRSGTLLVIAPEPAVEQWSALIATLDQREGVLTRTYAPRFFAAADVAALAERTTKPAGDDRWKLVVDDLTGTLVLTATPTQHMAMTALLDRLDAVPAESRRPARSYVIRNRSVNEVRAILEELARSGVLDSAAADTGLLMPAPGGASTATTAASVPRDAGNDGSPTVIAMPPAPGASPAGGAVGASTAQRDRVDPGLRAPSVAGSTTAGAARPGVGSQTGASLTFAVDEGTNTLIAVGEPRVLAQVEALLKSLDVRQPQVMLEVMLVTLTDGQTLDLGVELEQLQISNDVRIRLSSLFGLGSRNGNGDRVAGDGAGFTGVALSPGDFSIIIRALETLNEGRSQSMPKLLVGNNQTASLDSVVQQPFASVNASNTVSTTSFGGTQDAGTVVEITPQIAEGDHLVLRYSVSLSSFQGSSASPTLPPPRQQNRVASTATIPDGYTVVVGGIELQTRARTTSQVPFLGNIPILGEAFKNRNNADNSSRFFVFIRANVQRSRGFEELKYLSDRASNEAGVETGWPEVKPRLIR